MGRKELNPADVYRKQQRKKDLKKCKENRNVVRSVQELLSDPAKIEEEIVKAQKASDASALDKGLKDRIKELKMMKSVAITKQRIDVASGKTDRDAAAKLREAEMLQRDLNRERRRGLLADDHPTRKNDEAQNNDQGGTSSSYYKSQETDAYKGATEISSIAQQQVYHQLPVPMGIAPSMLPANSLSVQSTSFRPAPPPPRPPVFSLHPPPAYPDTLNGEQTVPLTTLAAMPVPPPPPPPRPFLPNLATIPVKNVSEEDHHLESNTLPTECEDSSVMEDEVVQPAQVEAPSASAAFSFPFSLTDFKLPSAEELMKRRHALVNDTEAVTVEFDSIDASASFPSYPHPHTLIEEQLEDDQHVISASEEIGDAEEVFKINPIRVRSIYIPPAVPVRAISGLGGLAGYGSDSDQDDDDEGSDSAPAQKQENIQIASDVPRFIPQKFTAMPSKYDVDSSNPVPAPPKATQLLPPTSSAHTNQNQHQHQLAATASTVPAAVSVSDDVNAFLESISSSEMDPTSSSRISQPSIAVAKKKPPLKPALKSVKLDAALTAFLPSALRVKRPAAMQAGRPMAKVASLVAPSAVPGASNSNSKETAMIGGVEDAYLNFLEEIGELTG
jgi:WW domain binding protein 11